MFVVCRPLFIQLRQSGFTLNIATVFENSETISKMLGLSLRIIKAAKFSIPSISSILTGMRRWLRRKPMARTNLAH